MLCITAFWLTELPHRVKSPHYRTAALLSASPQPMIPIQIGPIVIIKMLTITANCPGRTIASKNNRAENMKLIFIESPTDPNVSVSQLAEANVAKSIICPKHEHSPAD
jgi:hypothetical protein